MLFEHTHCTLTLTDGLNFIRTLLGHSKIPSLHTQAAGQPYRVRRTAWVPTV